MKWSPILCLLVGTITHLACCLPTQYPPSEHRVSPRIPRSPLAVACFVNKVIRIMGNLTWKISARQIPSIHHNISSFVHGITISSAKCPVNKHLNRSLVLGLVYSVDDTVSEGRKPCRGSVVSDGTHKAVLALAVVINWTQLTDDNMTELYVIHIANC